VIQIHWTFWLMVREHNAAARGFYEQAGFSQSSFHPEYYGKCDGLELVRDLGSRLRSGRNRRGNKSVCDAVTHDQLITSQRPSLEDPAADRCNTRSKTAQRKHKKRGPR